MFRRALREAAVLAVLSLLLAAGYTGVTGKGIFGPPPASPSARAASSSATPQAEIISVETASSLHEDGSALFVDTRHAYDFNLGHIRGAINIPLKEADALIAGLEGDRTRTIVVYCDGAECNSSLAVGASFTLNGYPDVRIFFGGWQAWKDAGLPMETGRQ